MNIFLIKAVIRSRKAGLLHLRPADKIIRLDCLADKCAKCCKTLGGPMVTQSEAEIIGSDSIMKTVRGLFIKSNGSVCSLLENGLCSHYPDRPKGCCEYPWYNIDGQLYYDVGCPGMKNDEDGRPKVDDIQPFENFFPGLPRVLVWLIYKICTR
ncbi:MAG: YkgJ family cysteine cluster protein [Planctomycetota bacterium]|jgi:Fe-S-cluster containining protein